MLRSALRLGSRTQSRLSIIVLSILILVLWLHRYTIDEDWASENGTWATPWPGDISWARVVVGLVIGVVRGRIHFLLCNYNLHDRRIEHLHSISCVDLVNLASVRLFHLLSYVVILIALLLIVEIHADRAWFEPWQSDRRQRLFCWRHHLAI